MRLSIRRRRPAAVGHAWLTQIITPRTNRATLASAEHMLAAIGAADPFSLEIATDQTHCAFVSRADSPVTHQHLLSQVAAAYPQADLRPIPAADDPACTRGDEKALTCVLDLRAPNYLPIRSFTDLDLDGERAAQADPVLGILTAFGALPEEWRGLCQIVLARVPENWSRQHARRAVQHPLENERVSVPQTSLATSVLACAALLGLVALGLQLHVWIAVGRWGLAVATVITAAGAIVALILLARHVAHPRVYDMDLVREKVSRVAFRVELRVSVFAPARAPDATLHAELQRVTAAFRRYSLATANGFVAGRARALDDCQRVSCRQSSRIGFGVGRRATILTVREIAGIWHLPHAAADVPLLERTTARRWLPLPDQVADGCPIGTATHNGRSVRVALPPDVLRRHALLVAKTRRGKSSLMLRLIAHAAEATQDGLLVIDPHVDLARAALGVLGPEREQDLVYLDVADLVRPFGLNPLDTELGWTRDVAVAQTLSVFQHEWGDRYWGPRMEDAFRFALMTLFEANRALCAADRCSGRQQQHTLLDVSPLLTDFAYRRAVLARVADAGVRTWWATYYDALDRRLQQEVANPILSKIHRFEGSLATRQVIGQPASTVDPADWVRAGRLVLVNTARGTIGDNAAALIGSTLINLTALAVAAQADRRPDQRARMTFFIDEFHTIPGADYDTLLSELSKYGANVVLATQSLARLAALGRDDGLGLGLRATVFANLDALFAFNCSAEDAEYLVPELGGQIDAQDLLELGDHQCYARISSRGGRLPAFWMELDPPPVPDAQRALQRAKRSAARYGRPADAVQADRDSAAARVTLAHEAARAPAAPNPSETLDSPPGLDAPHHERPRRRNEHRGRKRRAPDRAPTPQTTDTGAHSLADNEEQEEQEELYV